MCSKSSQLVCHLPPILGGGGTRDSDGEGPSGLNGEEKKTTGGKGSVTRKRSSKISKENIGKTKVLSHCTSDTLHMQNRVHVHVLYMHYCKKKIL